MRRYARVDGDHLAAHDFFAHLAGLVVFVARQSPGDDLGRHQFALDLPVEEVCAGIAAPQRAVAVKDRDLGTEGENGIGELLGRWRKDLGLQLEDPACSFCRSSGVSTLAATSGSLTAK